MSLPLAHAVSGLSGFAAFSKSLPTTAPMPVLFLGHGSPMNAIEENEFVEGFRQISKTIPKPKAILCISAHWETKGTWVTAMQTPKTIHDFGGFPKALFDVQYPAPGNPELAAYIQSSVKSTEVGLDEKWGLDHGAWSVIKHLYPAADVPVIQFSIDYSINGRGHLELGKQLLALRKRGILIIGSGNMVHNLGMVDWHKLNVMNYAYDWALEANQLFKSHISNGDLNALADFQKLGKAVNLAIPTPEHFLPLLYVLGLKEKDEPIHFFNDKAVGGSLTMTSLKLG